MSQPTPAEHYGRHHHETTALAIIAGNNLPLGLFPEQRIEAGTVALALDLNGPAPLLSLCSDHDRVVVELGPREVETILTEAAKVMARADVELRVVDPKDVAS